MKKAMMVLSLILTVGLSAALANKETNVDPKVLSAFNEEFSFAQNVKWQVYDHYTTFRFSLNDQGFIAYYSQEAELISTARNLLYNQLPLSVMNGLEEKYATAFLSGIVEVNKNGTTFYIMNAEKKGEKLMLQADASGNISVLKKIKT